MAFYISGGLCLLASALSLWVPGVLGQRRRLQLRIAADV
jgi:hypothetical protein